MKKCTCCGIEKPELDFYSCKKRKSGLRSKCKACINLESKEWALLNPEKRSEIHRRSRQKYTSRTAEWGKKYRAQNIELLHAKAAKYRAENRERLREVYRKWLAENGPKALAASACWKLKNHQRTKELSRRSATKWKAENKAAARAHEAAREAAKTLAFPAWADVKKIKVIYEKASALSESWGVALHVDHIVPINSKLVCGLHCEHNLQILESVINAAKGNRQWPDM